MIPPPTSERTRDFTGREWLFAEIDQWLADPNAPPYFIITGEPGIGKTAIAARLTQMPDMPPAIGRRWPAGCAGGVDF